MRPFAPIAILLAAAGTTYGSGAFPTASGSASTSIDMPECWSQCFGQFNVTGTPEMLCSPKISGFIEQCITVSCESAGESAAATQYTSWLHSFCGGHNPFASGSGFVEPPAPATSSSSLPVSTSSAPISEPPSSSTPIGGHAPAPVLTGTGGHPPFPPSATGLPSRPPIASCWQSCFTEFNITYPEALCFEHPGTQVSQCIQRSCQGSSDTNAYYQWVQGFCAPATTGAHSASTSSQSESFLSSVPVSSSVPKIPSSAPAFPVTGHPPVGTGSPAPPAFPPMPQCWQSCFTASNVTHPESLCYGFPGSAVSSCIKSGCDANSTQAYFGWVQSFCLGTTGSASAAPSTSSSSSEPATSSSVIPSMSASAPVISGTAPIISGTAPAHPHGTGVPSHPGMPACWGACFAQYNISTPGALCSRHPGNMVHSCISATCASNETLQYDSWLKSTCHVGTGTGVVPSTSSSVPFSSSAPAESSSLPGSSVVVHPTGAEPTGSFPYPTGGVSYPPCWGQCFAQSHVYSPTALCAPPVSGIVGDCISQSCNANSTAQYVSWQQSFCNHTIVPTGSGISVIPSTSSHIPSEPISSAVPPPQSTGSAHPPTNYTMPLCWTQCFQAYHVSNPTSLCSSSKSSAVGSCIANMCNGTDAAQYGGWKNSFCNNSTMPSGTGFSSSSYSLPSGTGFSSSSYALPNGTSSGYSVGPTVAISSSVPVIPQTSSAPLGTAPIGTAPHGTGSQPHPTGGSQPPSGNSTMPSCWTGCFNQFNVTNPLALCAPPTGPLVDTCIASRCNGTESGKFNWWLNDFCRKPVPTGSSPSFSFSIPSGTGVSASATPSASISASLSIPLGTAPVGTAPVGTAPVGTAPAGTGSLPPFPPSGTGVPSHPQMPGCWSKCFAENHVTSPASLCHPPMGSIVDSCISSTCTNGTDAAGYAGWLHSYCNSTMPMPSGSGGFPSSSSVMVSSSSFPVAPVSSSMPFGTAPVGTAPAGTAPAGTGSPFPPTGTSVPSHPAMPVCWTKCFSQNHVTSPSSLCHPPLGPLVDTCITSSCNGTAAAGYKGWLNTYCANSTAPISTGASSSVPVSSSAAVNSSSSIPASISVGPTGTAPHLPPSSGTGVPHPPGGDFPACWGACFAQNHVVAKGALCLQPTKDAVSNCITQSCAANETIGYTAWLNGFCPASTAPLGTGSSSSIAAPISTNVSSSSLPVSMAASSTVPISSVVAPGNSSVPVPPTNGTLPTNGTQIPACWTTCFKEHQVTSKDALCDPELTAYVAACIEGSCEAGSSDNYAHWVGEYCDAPSAPSPSSPPVVEPSTTPSVSASVPASASESISVSASASSSAPVIVDPVQSTSSSPASESSEATPTLTGNPQGPPTGKPAKPGKGKPGKPGKGKPNKPNKPNQPGLPSTWGPPPWITQPHTTTTPHITKPRKTKPHTTAEAPTTTPVVEPTPSSTTSVYEPITTTTSSSSSSSTLSSTSSSTSSSPVAPTQATVTQDPATVTVPATPSIITEHQTPTTMATAVKPTKTNAVPAGPPGGYPGGAPWGNGPPPWVGKVSGPPPPEVFKSIVEKIKNMMSSIRG